MFCEHIFENVRHSSMKVWKYLVMLVLFMKVLMKVLFGNLGKPIYSDRGSISER